MSLCLFLLLVSAVTVLKAEGTNAPPANPAPAPASAPAGSIDFSQYLVDHKAELSPFFDKNEEDLIRKAMPLALGLLAWIATLTLLAGWVVDMVLVRVFTPFFAPAYTKISRGIIYSTGRLLLGFLILGLIALTVFICSRFVHGGVIALVVTILLLVLGLGGHLAWLAYLYRLNVGTAVIFLVILVGAQAFTFVLVAAPILTGAPSTLAYRFVNETLTPEMQSEVDDNKATLTTLKGDCDATQAKIDELKKQITQDQAAQVKLAAEIEKRKNSELFIFQRIVKVEAAGDLAGARQQFTEMLAKYPTGFMSESVKAHLSQIDSELAAQEAARKQAEADAAKAAAAARADLLARAAKGQVTLSEMRRVLIGKSRADVTDLLGSPTETASDRWGYAQQMVLNPMTKEKHGLAIYFNSGVVQNVDFYYGAAK